MFLSGAKSEDARIEGQESSQPILLECASGETGFWMRCAPQVALSPPGIFEAEGLGAEV
jgi:hypothetical protein